jgi:NTE family protein
LFFYGTALGSVVAPYPKVAGCPQPRGAGGVTLSMSKGPDGPRKVLILSGGHALGAFQAGAYEALEAGGFTPDWILGTSIGAVNGAIICGNAPERRAGQLRRFWTEASGPDWPVPSPMAVPQTLLGIAAGLRSLLLGRPPLFLPNWMLTGAGAPHLFQRSSMPALLERVIDFERLNRGEPPLTLNATDVESGEQVLFHSRRDRLSPLHFLATTAFLPDFETIRIDGHVLCDGGFALNAPLDVLFEDLQAGPLTAILVDLYDPSGTVPTTLGAALRRRDELIFGNQLRRAIASWERICSQAGGTRAIRLLRIAYPSSPEEPPLKIYDYSRPTLTRRWALGHEAAGKALERLTGLGQPHAGLEVIEV